MSFVGYVLKVGNLTKKKTVNLIINAINFAIFLVLYLQQTILDVAQYGLIYKTRFLASLVSKHSRAITPTWQESSFNVCGLTKMFIDLIFFCFVGFIEIFPNVGVPAYFMD